MSAAEAQIASLTLMIEKLRRALYGLRSERKERLLDQLELALDDLTADASEGDLAAEKAAAATTEVKGFVRRKPFPEDLPCERVEVPGPESCACCGSERLSKVGEDVTETLRRACGRSGRPSTARPCPMGYRGTRPRGCSAAPSRSWIASPRSAGRLDLELYIGPRRDAFAGLDPFAFALALRHMESTIALMIVGELDNAASSAAGVVAFPKPGQAHKTPALTQAGRAAKAADKAHKAASAPEPGPDLSDKLAAAARMFLKDEGWA